MEYYIIVTENREHPTIEKIIVDTISMNSERTYYDGRDEEDKWVGFTDLAIGVDVFPSFNEATKRLSELLIVG
jgi:hypothetical protein